MRSFLLIDILSVTSFKWFGVLATPCLRSCSHSRQHCPLWIWIVCNSGSVQIPGIPVSAPELQIPVPVHPYSTVKGLLVYGRPTLPLASYQSAFGSILKPTRRSLLIQCEKRVDGGEKLAAVLILYCIRTHGVQQAN